MKINKVTRIVFSPTGGTRKIVNAIAQNIECEEQQYFDLTHPDNRKYFEYNSDRRDELIILGLPVYEEHMPPIVLDALSHLKGNGQPIALVAVYGNIGFGICLKEMQEWAFTAGFIVVGGATFISEHSFSHDEFPLSAGRPDMMDLYHAEHFGQVLVKKLDTINDILKYTENVLPGKLALLSKLLPKNSVNLFAKIPNLNKRKCEKCGACLKVCPSGAIDPETFAIDKDKCLLCFACVRACPSTSRKIHLKMTPIVKTTLKEQNKKARIPEIFI